MTAPPEPILDIRVNEEQINTASAATIHATSAASNRYDGVNVTRLPTDDDETELVASTSSILHIYSKGEVHQLVSPTIDPSKERTSGPKSKEQKAEKEERKRIRQDPTLADNDESAFFLHRPYLAFHVPPRVLYAGSTKYAKPVVLIHAGGWWKYFKLQIGPSLGEPGVLDPRGVVAWKHNGGDKQTLKADDRKLKGYKIRTWRLWGEHGKEYVHTIKKNRNAKEGPDPDVFEKDDSDNSWPRRAEEVVYLRWSSPLSRRTRQYHFQYAGVEFQWKGTGTVKESKRCGAMLRFNHLKLVAILPKGTIAKGEKQDEVCLGKYTSSLAKEKYGKLEFFDAAILQLVEDHLPSLLEQAGTMETTTENGAVTEEGENNGKQLARIKRSTLYSLFVATAMCMVLSEQEKRHTVLAFLLEAGEGGGS